MTPEQFVAGLTDFGPGRATLFGNSADGYLKVHDTGAGHADVTEGSGGIWERLRYDWSDPNHIVLTTTDSNLWGGASSHTYTLTRTPRWNDQRGRGRGTGRQEPQGQGARLSAWYRREELLERAFDNSVKAIEARNYEVSAGKTA